MKKLFLLLISFHTLVTYSQKIPYFLTTFYFGDAIGNRDSIDIGYDTSAKSAFNPDFGEIINQSPFKSEFDVRAVHYFEYYGNFPPSAHLIVNKIVGGAEKVANAPCFGGEALIFFIQAVHQPITISVKSVIAFEKMDCPSHNSYDFFSPDQNYNFIEPWVWAKGSRYGCLKDSTYTLYLGKGAGSLNERPYILEYEIEGRGKDTIYGLCFTMDQSFYFCDEFYVGTKDAKYSITKDDLVLYPNPVSDYFDIKSELSGNPKKCFIYDQTGKEIKNICMDGNKFKKLTAINLNELPTGMYFLKVEFENGTKRIKKFIKI